MTPLSLFLFWFEAMFCDFKRFTLIRFWVYRALLGVIVAKCYSGEWCRHLRLNGGEVKGFYRHPQQIGEPT